MATTTAYNKMNDPSDIDQGTIGDEKWPEKQNYSELLSSASNTSRSEYRSIQHDKETIKTDETETETDESHETEIETTTMGTIRSIVCGIKSHPKGTFIVFFILVLAAIGVKAAVEMYQKRFIYPSTFDILLFWMSTGSFS
eukprot:170063_1